MNSYLIVLLIIGYVLCLQFYFVLAKRYGILDVPNLRSSHDYQTIRGGGVLFVVAGIVGLLVISPVSWYVLAGLIIISVVSFVDDIISLSSKKRLFFQVLACGLLIIEFYTSYFLWFTPVLVVFMLALVNAYNFMDGINGMNGLYSLSFMCGMAGFYYCGVELNIELVLSVAISICVFGFFNFRKKAVCFSGDVGSVAMAYIILYLLFHLASAGYFLSILMLLVYGLDTFWTVVERALNKERITDAHRKHLYQLLVNEGGSSHLKISIFYALIQLLINVFILTSVKYNFNQWVIAAVLLFVGSLMYLLAKKSVKKRVLTQDV